MDSPERHFDDQTLAGAGPGIKDASSSGTGAPSPFAAGAAVTGGGATAARAALNSQAILEVGTLLGGRYEIIEILGIGGMGAVYKAYDRDIERLIAVKVIRPDLAANPELLQRFKQELLLARQIAHKNVVRIFDVRESAGVKFITMEYIEGRDLRSLLAERGKLPASEALEIMQQVCAGLVAAHVEGVIHRDLKPGNIMRDSNGRVVVMDFGLARTVDAPGMTQTGAMLGTMEYMSPEQAMAQKLDARSDLFTLGLILYELLSGKMPYQADSALASLLKRTRERAAPVSDIEAAIPRSLSAVVSKCLECNPDDRYQTADELLAALEQIQGKKPSSIYARPAVRPGYVRSAIFTAAAVLAAVAIALGIWTSQQRRTPSQHAPVSVLIADFKNETGDAVFDGTLEPAFGVALEGASFITDYSRGRAHKVAAQLQPGSSALDETLARLVATREGVNVVVSGDISRQQDKYELKIDASDPITGKPLVTAEETTDKKDVLLTAGKLAARIRKALGDKTPESVQLAAAETYTTGSLEAAHEYTLAQTAQFTGKYNDAIEHSLKALQLDPELGRAYVVLAVVYNNMKQPQQAEKYFQLALARIDRMSDREKYRTRSGYYLVVREPDKALEQSQELVKQYPADDAGIANLALAYFYRRDMASALEQGKRAIQIYPKNTIQRNNVGLYEMYAGDFDAAVREQGTVRQMNPSMVLGYVGTALPQLALGHPDQAIATYREAEKLGADGASAAASGLADVALYQGRFSEAIKILRAGIAQDLSSKNPDGAATKLASLAQAQVLNGNAAEAASDATRALALSHDVPIRFWAARAYIAANQDAKAQAIARDLGNSLQADPQAYGKIVEGEIQLHHGKPQAALKLFLESRKLADTWMGRFDAGRAYVEAGAFAEADSELEICQQRRGEATALFLDESPTYYLFPPVYYYFGRAQEGLKSPAAASSYQTFIGIKNGGEDPLLADARRRGAPGS